MKIWIATGGTGGHIFPALAVSRELVNRGHRVIISSDGRFMSLVKKDKAARAGTAFIWAGPVGNKSKIKQAWSLFKICASAAALVLRWTFLRPDRVVAFGGYASVAPVLAARVWRIPALLHEQNAAMGWANRFSMRGVGVLMTSFPKVKGIPASSDVKIIYTGLPVRDGFNPSPKTDFDYRLLVTGGSQGATVLDQVVPAAIEKLPASLKKKIFVVHQTRIDATPKLDKAYRTMGVRANVLSFIHDMAGEVTRSDLVISRGGASTIVELQTVGRPAILVPLDVNPDQAANSESFEKQGAGFAVPQNKFTPKWLAHAIEDLFENPARLQKMAEKARLPNQAVKNIVKTIEI